MNSAHRSVGWWSGVLVLGTPLIAEQRTWDQPAFGVFSFGASWREDQPPGPDDLGLFGATLTTTFNPITTLFIQNAAVRDLVVTSGDYTFEMANPPLFIDLGGDLAVGPKHSNFDPGLSDSARLLLEFDGSLVGVDEVAGEIFVGTNLYGHGVREAVLEIRGDRTVVRTDGGMFVGPFLHQHVPGEPPASVFIHSGARVTNAARGGLCGIGGTLSVAGPGSEWIDNGQLWMYGAPGNPARLSIGAGGHSRVGYIAIVGIGTDQPAEVVVEGAGSTWDVTAGIWLGNDDPQSTGALTVGGGLVTVDSDVSVGRSAPGTFLVQEAGVVRSGHGFIGTFANAPGDAMVSGPGARWETLGGGITVGRESEGVLDVLGGGRVVSAWGPVVGEFPGVVGALRVRGEGSSLTHIGDIDVARRGVGSLMISDGAAVTSGGWAYVGREPGSDGRVTVTGQSSHWAVGGRLCVGCLGTGSLELDSSGRVIVGSAAPVSGAVAVGAGGILAGGGTIAGNVVNQGGAISPGASPGVLRVEGGVRLLAGALAIELGGVVPRTGYDVLSVEDELALGGRLEVYLTDGFMPSSGQRFTIAQTGSIVGSFEQVNLPGLPNGVLELRVTPTAVILSVCAADFNGDGNTNVQDFLAFLSAFDAGDPRADFTGDGIVNIQDFLAFLTAYAAGCA